MSDARWTKDQLKLAFFLYCQLPFGRLHRTNPRIIELARELGRTPSALAMKLVNFASLDPAIRESGRKGLGNASRLDREVWEEFHADWEGLATEAIDKISEFVPAESSAGLSASDADLIHDYTGATKISLVSIRLKQQFFRAAILSSSRSTCCMSGASDPRLLSASHIVPWSVDRGNRLNPRNGLCLSALHDRAYDRGLITVTGDYRVRVSSSLKKPANDAFLRDTPLPLDGRQIELPERFQPDPALLERHYVETFLRHP